MSWKDNNFIFRKSGFSLGEPLDLLENRIQLEKNIQPWKIVTFAVFPRR